MWRISVILVVLLVAGSTYSQSSVEDKNKQASKADKKTDSDQRGTEKSPLIIKVLTSEENEAQARQEDKYKTEHANNERWTMQATIGLVVVTAALVLVTTFLAIFTYRLWSTTKTMVEKSEKVSGSQLTEMQKSIAEQARAASAMEEVGKHISISAKAATESVTLSRERSAQQMRAYLSVNIGVAIYQERDKGLKFEAKPLILNTGHTPAHKVSYRAKAGILSVPLPDDFSFPLDEKVIGAAVLGPQQHFIINAVVDELCDDAEVDDIKKSKGKGLYMWGIVTYEDVFGGGRKTRFCHQVTWRPDGKIWGYCTTDHNDAT